jgi:hypothetical protein
MIIEANKIDLDNVELNLLEEKLADMRKNHEDYWNNYGSELCSGSMSEKEKKLEEQIRLLKENGK